MESKSPLTWDHLIARRKAQAETETMEVKNIPSVPPPPTEFPELPELEVDLADTDAKPSEAEEGLRLDSATVLALLEEAKAQVREEIREEIEEEIRDEYRAKPIYRGLLGGLAWIFGKMPDSHGRPSGSWTLYILSHIPVLFYIGAAGYAVFKGTTFKALSVISPWIVLTPMLLSWMAWLAHHKKVAMVVVSIIDAVGRAFAGIKGNTAFATAATTINNVVSQAKPDAKLKPGEKVEPKKRDPSAKPKTDPNSLPQQPLE